MIKRKTVKRICKCCKKEFQALVDNIKRGFGNYCSKTCSNKANKLGFKKGHKLSEEAKKKISIRMKEKRIKPPSNLGKKFPNRKKPSKITWRGENHGNWKGGITPLEVLIRSSFKNRQWRSDIFTRDNFTCQDCGRKERLETHHIKPLFEIIKDYNIKTLEDADVCEELWNLNNGTTLCISCHKKI